MVTEISQTLSSGSVVCLPRIVDRLEGNAVTENVIPEGRNTSKKTTRIMKRTVFQRGNNNINLGKPSYPLKVRVRKSVL